MIVIALRVSKQGLDPRAAEPRPSAEERQVDQETEAAQLGPVLSHQLSRGAGGPPGGEHVVHDQHPGPGPEGVGACGLPH